VREAVFVRLHARAWEEFEREYDGARDVAPEALAEGYVRLTDDLAYARTFYPGSPTAAYLNGLAALVHRRLYRNRREERGRLVTFWTREVPQTVYEERRPLLLSLALFATFVAVGALSAAFDDTYVRLILGDAYVNMTLANIERGDPMAVYKHHDQAGMFVGIAHNNILVAFYCFLGLFPVGRMALPGFSFGTAYLLMGNGVMLGAFQYFFYEHGVFWESVRTIWIHGTLEISAVVVAGGAGLAMGNALLFPGTYPRLVALRRGAARGMKMVVGLVPVFVVAAALEGFVTRHTGMPLTLSLAVIMGSLAFVLGYFVWLPARVGRGLGAAAGPAPNAAPVPAAPPPA
jgi:uncharacterized membrane protein SpoIIM required for sporulation